MGYVCPSLRRCCCAIFPPPCTLDVSHQSGDEHKYVQIGCSAASTLRQTSDTSFMRCSVCLVVDSASAAAVGGGNFGGIYVLCLFCVVVMRDAVEPSRNRTAWDSRSPTSSEVSCAFVCKTGYADTAGPSPFCPKDLIGILFCHFFRFRRTWMCGRKPYLIPVCTRLLSPPPPLAVLLTLFFCVVLVIVLLSVFLYLRYFGLIS